MGSFYDVASRKSRLHNGKFLDDLEFAAPVNAATNPIFTAGLWDYSEQLLRGCGF
jgi:hypothetical protein